MITESDLLWWKETNALKSKLKIAESNLLQTQRRIAELEKQLLGYTFMINFKKKDKSPM